MIGMRDAHPVLMLEEFLKAAQAAQRPFRMSDMRGGASGLGKAQRYAQPNPPAAQTRPDLVEPQKATPPPPVT